MANLFFHVLEVRRDARKANDPEEAEAEYGAEAGPAQGGAGDRPGGR